MDHDQPGVYSQGYNDDYNDNEDTGMASRSLSSETISITTDLNVTTSTSNMRKSVSYGESGIDYDELLRNASMSIRLNNTELNDNINSISLDSQRRADFRAWLTEQHRKQQGEPPYDIVSYLIGSVETSTNSKELSSMSILERAIRRP